jgi:hypothetical protein
MSAYTKISLSFFLFASLSCGLFAPVTTATPTLAPVMETATAEERIARQTPTPNLLATQIKADAMTKTALAARTPSPLPSATVEIDPNDLVEKSKPIPPPALSPGRNYRLEDEVLIGAYGIRFWHNVDNVLGEDIVLIEKEDTETIKIEAASAIAPLTGADINGDGNPEVVIETYTGGAHCCFGTQVYSLGETPKLILDKPRSNAGGQFQDLDGDRIYEFVTYDDIFTYEYCPYVSSPFVKVIMAYDEEEERYLPASPHFVEEYAEDIEKDTKNAERVAKANKSENGEWDETTKCSILPITLDYLYSGDPDTARAELERLYGFNDLNRFWNDILFLVQDSPLYVPSVEKEE